MSACRTALPAFAGECRSRLTVTECTLMPWKMPSERGFVTPSPGKFSALRAKRTSGAFPGPLHWLRHEGCQRESRSEAREHVFFPCCVCGEAREVGTEK